ncbi:MAG: RNA methyltransferase [Nitrosomonadales bacterium]|nr:RNA methyltransferase [Nitrosomonadales bacterium]
MKIIQSRDNPFYKELVKLSGSSRQRGKTSQTLLDGAHLLTAYLDAGHVPCQVLVNAAALQDGEIASLLGRLSSNPVRAELVEAHSPFDKLRANGQEYKVPVTQLDDKLFAELSELKTPTGILALIDIPQPAASIADSRFALLLEDIQDPGNLGSMLRSAAAAGCDAVFMSAGCADAWSPKVLRAAMGGHFSLRQGSGQAMRIYERQDLLSVAKEFPGTLLATSLQATRSLYDCDLRGNVAFMIGNEGAGLSAGLLNLATHKISIPMPGKIESLNAAAATAICLFEVVRQRLKP